MSNPLSPTSHSTTLPSRSTGGFSDDEAVPDIDPTDTAGLLLERLQAYKHACGYLENYFTATEKLQKTHSKEYEKLLKTVSDPLKEGHHFDQTLGGVAGFFENIRSNTQGIATSYLETEKNIKGTVLPILARLHQEIKHKAKELNSGAAKSSKSVAAARNTTQKHIELLGQHTASYDSAGGKVDNSNDPYVIRRNINHALHKQLLEENSNHQDLLAVQESFQTFETHVLQTIQSAMTAFLQAVGSQADRQKAMYGDMVGTAQRIPPDFEWNKFLQRNGTLMIDPSAPKRTMSNISFPNQNHAATKPMIAGTLERKSRAMGALSGFKTGYYIVTPAKYLHQYDDDDDFRKDPTPDLSLYLPDCTFGSPAGEKFNIKGKDISGGKVKSKMATSHEFNFKAHTSADAEKWWSIIKEASGQGGKLGRGGGGVIASPISPTDHRNVSGGSVPPGYEEKQGVPSTHAPLQNQAPAPGPIQTQGLSQGVQAGSAVPGSAKEGPLSAGPGSAHP